MRKNRFIWMIATILLCGLTVVSLTACSSDDPEPAPENPEEQGDPSSDVDWTAIHNELQPQLVDSASVSMYDFFNDIYENATQGNDPEDELRAAWAKMNIDKLYQTADSLAKTEGSNGYGTAISSILGAFRLKTAYIRYLSVGADGSKTVLTTLVAWPYYSFPSPIPTPTTLFWDATAR